MEREVESKGERGRGEQGKYESEEMQHFWGEKELKNKEVK